MAIAFAGLSVAVLRMSGNRVTPADLSLIPGMDLAGLLLNPGGSAQSMGLLSHIFAMLRTARLSMTFQYDKSTFIHVPGLGFSVTLYFVSLPRASTTRCGIYCYFEEKSTGCVLR